MSLPLKKALEELLAEKRLLGPRSLVEGPDLQPAGFVTGIPEWDSLLGGGFRKGATGEITGRASTGRTAFALLIAAAASREDLVAWVDPLDRFSPHAAEGAGVDPRHLLWLRGGVSRRPAGERGASRGRHLADAVAATQALADSALFGLVVLDFADVPDRVLSALPLAWGQRLLQAFEDRDTACLVLARRRFVASPRGLSVHLKVERARFDPAGDRRSLSGLETSATRPFPRLRTVSLGWRA